MLEYIKSDEDDDNPFFAYLAYTAPHWPLQAPAEYINKYKGQYDDGYDALTENRLKSLEQIGLIEPGHIASEPAYPETEFWNNLSDEQKQIVATYASQFIPTGEEWLNYRRDIQNAARKLFVTRKFNKDFETELIALMQNPDTYKSDIYKQSSEHNQAVTATLISEIFTTMSHKQRDTLLKNIDELIETVENFKK